MNTGKLLPLAVSAGWAGMIGGNFLANRLPFNGMETGTVSALYPNLLIPAGFTFSLWAVIYLLTGAFTVAHWIPGLRGLFADRRIDAFFIAGCLLNFLWLLLWHYLYPGAALLVLMLLAFCNGYLVLRVIPPSGNRISIWLLLDLPFQIYFGWTFIAVLLNGAALAVHLGVPGISTLFSWVSVVLIAAVAVVSIQLLLHRNARAILLVSVWAYCGIAARHLYYFKGRYPQVLAATGCAVVFSIIYLKIAADRRRL